VSGTELVIRGSGRFVKREILRCAGRTVLDVGCGGGRFSRFAADAGRAVVALDVDPRRLAEIDGLPRVRADAARLPFADDSFETVFLINVVEHVEDDVAALREAARVAARNILVSVPKRDTYPSHRSGLVYRGYFDPTHLRYYTEEALKATLEKAGFGNFRIAHSSRVRPAFFYHRLGYPRLLLKVLDSLFWFFGRKSDRFYQTLFAEATT